MLRVEVEGVTLKSEVAEKWEALEFEILNCKKCRLWKGRKNPVPGEGPLNSKVMFVGEAPGKQEDIEGRPFVGAAGRLLTELLESNGISRSRVYITNIIKCRPPNNRDPLEDEVEACNEYLERQVKLLKPKLIVCLGRHSARHFFKMANIEFKSLPKIRGSLYKVRVYDVETWLTATYHPAAALYNPKLKEYLVEDFKKISKKLPSLLREDFSPKTLTLEDFLT